MNSMTGFGQAAVELEHHRATITVRGVNHRHLDVALRLRDDLRELEAPLRELIGRSARRGRVEVVVEIVRRAVGGPWPGLERESLVLLRETTEGWAREGLLPSPATTSDLLRGLASLAAVSVAGPSGAPMSIAEADRPRILQAAEKALGEFALRRQTEGAALRRILVERLEDLERAALALRARRPQALAEAHAALRKRLSDLVGEPQIDPLRLAQEAAILADRSDVQEELDRLSTHLAHARELMDGEAPGRRLDFLAQEIFRELNTLGTKSRDGEMVRGVLDAKVVCEQFREQLQNVE